LIAAVRAACREMGGTGPSIHLADELLDERRAASRNPVQSVGFAI